MKKSTACLTAAAALGAALLSGCGGAMDSTPGTNPPAATVWPTAAPTDRLPTDILPEAEDLVPELDRDDGIVQDRDGIITDSDTRGNSGRTGDGRTDNDTRTGTAGTAGGNSGTSNRTGGNGTGNGTNGTRGSGNGTVNNGGMEKGSTGVRR